ncbi:MAG: hypothetical protein JWR88_1508, partial [Pseudonocardia sp.]|nr:hypothetical protein [Pseudonocardia sp.]
MARNSAIPGGPGVIGVVAGAIGRLAWAALLPFGLANLAYWSRPLSADNSGRGAFTLRLFGLGLTALFVVTVGGVSMDLVGRQCYQGEQPQCGRLPAVFDVLAGLPFATRLAITSVVPVLVTIGLWALSALTRNRYEAAGPRDGPDLLPADPVLATPGFWASNRLVRGLGRLHLSTALAVVTLLSAVPVLTTGADICRTPEGAVDGCAGALAARLGDTWPSAVGAAAAFAVLIIVLVAARARIVEAPDVPDRRSPELSRSHSKRSLILLFGASATFLWQEGALAFGTSNVKIDETRPLLGVTAGPTIIGALLLGLALSALAWRTQPARRRWPVVWGLLIAASILATSVDSAAIVAGAVLLVVTTAGFVAIWRQVRAATDERIYSSWSGAGPGVLLGVSLVTAFLLSSLSMLLTGDLLNGARNANELVLPAPELAAAMQANRGTGLCGQQCPLPDPALQVPIVYLHIGLAILFALGALAAVVLVAFLRTKPEPRDQEQPTPNPPSRGRAGDVATLAARLWQRILRTRRTAALTHRAEPAVGVLIVLGLGTAVFALLASALQWKPWTLDGLPGAVATWLVNAGATAVALVGLAAVAGLAGGAALGGKRPLGLVWDLMCFLPRAGHPFAPPCYAERAVPEIARRCVWWLDDDDGRRLDADADEPDRPRSLVLSAHSLGATLAVAAVLALMVDDRSRLAKVRLLTYGCQLRSYFGRLFPELLGPRVLGTPGCRGAQLFSSDPWEQERQFGPPGTDYLPPRDSVRRLLTSPEKPSPRWRNLWRPTDYLGFPVWGYRPNPVDRLAEEVDVTAYLPEIGAHRGYPRTAAYREALTELAPP